MKDWIYRGRNLARQKIDRNGRWRNKLGVAIGLEPSPETLHGLSHREWGDRTGARAALMETVNPVQGRLRGRTDAALVVSGKDRYFEAAARRGRLNVPFDANGWPLDVRVARPIRRVLAFVEVANIGDARYEEIRGVAMPGRWARVGISVR